MHISKPKIVCVQLVHAAIIQRSSNPTEFFLDEFKHMIDEEEEGLGEDDGPVTSVRDNKTFTPSVRRKLSEALSYSHENFKKFEVIGRNSSSTLEGYKSEQVQQAYVRAENKVMNKIIGSSKGKEKAQCSRNRKSSCSAPPTNTFRWAILLH